MTLTLYDCTPMDARISQAQCKKNRGMSDNLAIGIMKDHRCKGCPGLGEPTTIALEGVMGTKNKPCVSEGCTRASWMGGFCWKHHPDHVANKAAALQSSLDKNAKEQTKLSDRVTLFEERLRKQYTALDVQMAKLTALNTYVTQQVTLWNKSTG